MSQLGHPCTSIITFSSQICSSMPRWDKCKHTAQGHEVTTVSKPYSDIFSLFVRTEPKYLSWHQPEGLLHICSTSCKYQCLFHDTKHPCQEKERTSSTAGGDSFLSSWLFWLSLFFRDQGHFQLKTAQFKHFMLRQRIHSASKKHQERSLNSSSPLQYPRTHRSWSVLVPAALSGAR